MLGRTRASGAQSISLPKLSGLMEMDVASLRSQLMLLKSTSVAKTWNGCAYLIEVLELVH